MAPPSAKNKYWLVTIGILSVAVVSVIALLVYLLLTLPSSTTRTEATPTLSQPELSLPTAPLPTATPGPPMPSEINFTVVEPIKGFSDCAKYGFKGTVMASNGSRLAGIQVIIWQEGVGLLAIDTSKTDGSYVIEIAGKPTQRKLWAQVYQNDVPVSNPVLLETQAGCQQGFQIYEINWREQHSR